MNLKGAGNGFKFYLRLQLSKLFFQENQINGMDAVLSGISTAAQFDFIHGERASRGKLEKWKRSLEISANDEYVFHMGNNEKIKCVILRVKTTMVIDCRRRKNMVSEINCDFFKKNGVKVANQLWKIL